MYFDIGANGGAWTIANINSCDKIVAIEASPYTFSTLNSNLNSNGKVILVNKAVCNNNGKDIIFYQAENNQMSSINKNWLTDEKSRFFNHPYTKIVCETITIDELIKIYGLPEFIKIDVEGGEYECITSLSQKVNQLCFEWASETNDITFNCLDYLNNLGFTEFYVQMNSDEFTFRPQNNDYYGINETKHILNNTKNKIDWGMLWCK